MSILCPDAEVADALATSVFIMGTTKGLELINKLKNFEALIIDKNDKMFVSNNLKLD